jgi:NAD(P)-dependent dehydrogenase (short-subunit alcohol dehydrogenase family)
MRIRTARLFAPFSLTLASLTLRAPAVVLACRSASRGEALAASLRASAARSGLAAPSLEVAALDLASLDSVRAFASEWALRPDASLSCLVNNAGIFDMGSSRPQRDAAGHEAHWSTNFLAPALLALLLLPTLARGDKAGGDTGGSGVAGRVVFVSSIMHTVGELNLDDPDYKSAP